MSTRRSPLHFVVLFFVVLSRPGLWWTAIRVGIGMIPRRWWTRWPFLPVPDPAYIRFRTVTAYGGDGTTPIRSDDLVSYLEWCRHWWD